MACALSTRARLSTTLIYLITVITACGLMLSSQVAYAQRPMLSSVHDYPVPQGSALPWGTTVGSDHKVWVALPGCDASPGCPPSTPPGQIAVFNPTSLKFIVDYHLPKGYSQAFFLAFDKEGRLWFPLTMSNAIGMFNPKKRAFHMWTVPTPNAGPWDLAIDGQGKIWFTEHFSNKIGRFDPVTKQFLEIPTPATNSQPYGITIDASNNVWFTENNPQVALIAEYTAGGSLLEYKIRNSYDSNLTPHLITIDHTGNVWWSEGFVGMLGRLDISVAKPGTNNGVTEYAYHQHSGGAHTSGIGVDSNGLIWFDDSLQNIFGSFPETGKGQFSLYSSPGNHPHDGLLVDSSNRIWFDEEFANALALAIQ